MFVAQAQRATLVVRDWSVANRYVVQQRGVWGGGYKGRICDTALGVTQF